MLCVFEQVQETGEAVKAFKTYPEVKVDELVTIFGSQKGAGYWELGDVGVIHLSVAKVTQVLDKAGAKSLGEFESMEGEGRGRGA